MKNKSILLNLKNEVLIIYTRFAVLECDNEKSFSDPSHAGFLLFSVLRDCLFIIVHLYVGLQFFGQLIEHWLNNGFNKYCLTDASEPENTYLTTFYS